MSYQEYFKKSTINEWISKANADLKGKVVAEDLRYSIDDDIQFSPFLTDSSNDLPINNPDTKSGVFIECTSDQLCNERAKAMLQLGAQVLAFQVTPESNWDDLFNDIYLDMITVYCFCEKSENILTSLQKYLSSKYSTTVPDIVLLEDNEILRLGYEEKFTTRVKIFKEYIHTQNKNTYYVAVDLKKDFLTQIGELRAMRKIFKKEIKDSSLTILSFINTASYKDVEIHPLIITNYLFMAAYLGMSDVVFGIPLDTDAETARLSLHIQNILKEESGFQNVQDPTSGSYIIEKITKELLDYSTKTM